MEIAKLLGTGPFYEPQVYRRPTQNLDEMAMPFSGTLRHHYNPNMMLLLTDPLEPGGTIYEFRREDIVYVEELPSVNGPEGVILEKVKIWLKKGCIAMKMEPFRVGDGTLSGK